MATYLQTVNAVLARLREDSVASVTTNTYSTLIGKFVNDAKRQVEDSWNWDALYTVVTVNTVTGTSNYIVTGSGLRQKQVTVNNTSSNALSQLINVPREWILDQQDLSTVQQGQPINYAWNGTDGTDSKVELFPTPDAVYALKFRMYVPQATLSSDGDVITIPTDAIEMGAYARALVERGEDGGLNSSESYAMFKSILADQIAIEASRYIENDVWSAC
jgi:hypothetical protein